MPLECFMYRWVGRGVKLNSFVIIIEINGISAQYRHIHSKYIHIYIYEIYTWIYGKSKFIKPSNALEIDASVTHDVTWQIEIDQTTHITRDDCVRLPCKSKWMQNYNDKWNRVRGAM